MTNKASQKLNIMPDLPVDRDPFDPERARITTQDVASTNRVVLTIPVRCPRPEEFFRIHPSLTVDVALLDHEREMYLVVPEMGPQVPQANGYTLYYGVTRSGSEFLWQVRLPGLDGRTNPWWLSARLYADYAKTKWTRIWADMGAGSYAAVTAPAAIPEPQWPNRTLRDLLFLAFKDRLIDSEDHAILRILRGEV